MKAIINYSTALLHEMLSTHGNSRVEKGIFRTFFSRAPQFCGKASALTSILVALSRQILFPPFFSSFAHSQPLLLQRARVAQKSLFLFYPPSLRRRRRRLSALGERGGGKGRRIMVGSCCSRRRRKRRRRA